MTATAQLSKLAELRAKTDQELISILDNALDLGLRLALNEADVDPAGVLHRRAADIYADSVMLVEKVEDVGERRQLEEKLRQLRNGLDRQPAGSGGRLHQREMGRLFTACRVPPWLSVGWLGIYRSSVATRN